MSLVLYFILVLNTLPISATANRNSTDDLMNRSPNSSSFNSGLGTSRGSAWTNSTLQTDVMILATTSFETLVSSTAAASAAPAVKTAISKQVATVTTADPSESTTAAFATPAVKTAIFKQAATVTTEDPSESNSATSTVIPDKLPNMTVVDASEPITATSTVIPDELTNTTAVDASEPITATSTVIPDELTNTTAVDASEPITATSTVIPDELTNTTAVDASEPITATSTIIPDELTNTTAVDASEPTTATSTVKPAKVLTATATSLKSTTIKVDGISSTSTLTTTQLPQMKITDAPATATSTETAALSSSVVSTEITVTATMQYSTHHTVTQNTTIIFVTTNPESSSQTRTTPICTTTRCSSNFNKEESRASTPLILGAIMFVLLLIIVALGLTFRTGIILHVTESIDASSLIDVELTVKKSWSSDTENPTKLADFEKVFHEMCKDDNCQFQHEFDQLEINSRSRPDNGLRAQLPSFTVFNRYVNILPFDDSAVVLEDGVPEYINACYITGYNWSCEYISAQTPISINEENTAFGSPKQTNVNDFWRMIWQENSSTVVMLTNLVENGRVCSGQYWPAYSRDSVIYGNIMVTLIREVDNKYYITRILEVLHIKHNVKRVIVQFHCSNISYVNTHDVDNFINFVKVVRETFEAQKLLTGPLVVTCSTGVGHTGIFIALDYLIQDVKNNESVDILKVVHRMRNQRNKLVQFQTQYVYLYACLNVIIRNNLNQL